MWGESSAASQLHHVYRTPAAPRAAISIADSELVVGIGILAIACSMIIVQTCDAATGVLIWDRMKTFGPAGTALLNLAAVVWLAT
jgi:hypothetical protein